MKLECGVQLLTLNRLSGQKDKLPTLLNFLSTAGTKTLEISGLPNGIDATTFAELLNDNGLNVCGNQISFHDLQNNVDRIADEALTYGAYAIEIADMPFKYRENIDGINEFCDAMNKASDIISDREMVLCYHNKKFEFTEDFDGTPIFDILLEKGNFDIGFDVFQTTLAKANVEEWIDKIGNHLLFLHIKDMKKRLLGVLPPKAVAPGKGSIDYLKILEQCEGYSTKCALIDIDNPTNNKQAIADGITYLKKNYLFE